MSSGARIIPGNGTVVCGGPLTIVIAGGDAVGLAALAVVDTLDRTNSWTFDNVAAALHELVVAQNPTGVSAVLDIEDEAIVFAFDRAEAVSGDLRVKGDGRAGWSTAVVDVSPVELRLDSVPFTSAGDDIELRSGRVPGAGAVVPVTVPSTTGTPPESEASSSGAAPPPAERVAPPPPPLETPPPAPEMGSPPPPLPPPGGSVPPPPPPPQPSVQVPPPPAVQVPPPPAVQVPPPPPWAAPPPPPPKRGISADELLYDPDFGSRDFGGTDFGGDPDSDSAPPPPPPPPPRA